MFRRGGLIPPPGGSGGREPPQYYYTRDYPYITDIYYTPMLPLYFYTILYPYKVTAKHVLIPLAYPHMIMDSLPDAWSNLMHGCMRI